MKDGVLFSKALEYAAKMHRKQTRRDRVTPYILHPIAVSEIVRSWGYDVRYQVVALLHDTLEDTKAKEEEILEFGEDILEAVKLLTKSEDMKAEDEGVYLDSLIINDMAKVVKAADKIHNMREVMLTDDKEWAKRYIAKSRKYYYGRFGARVDTAIEEAEQSV